jgi:hypothetical protein
MYLRQAGLTLNPTFRIFNAFAVGDSAWLRKPRSNANTHVVRNIFMKRFLLLAIWTLVSCTTSVNQADNVSSEIPKTAEFEDFVNLFKKRLTKIPNDYINKYLRVDTLRFETDA